MTFHTHLFGDQKRDENEMISKVHKVKSGKQTQYPFMHMAANGIYSVAKAIFNMEKDNSAHLQIMVRLSKKSQSNNLKLAVVFYESQPATRCGATETKQKPNKS